MYWNYRTSNERWLQTLCAFSSTRICVSVGSAHSFALPLPPSVTDQGAGDSKPIKKLRRELVLQSLKGVVVPKGGTAPSLFMETYG